MVHVKICGLSRPEDIEAARDADAIGFVVASPKSHRNIPFDVARNLSRFASPFQTIVAVTAETDGDVLTDIVEGVRPQALQLPFRTRNEVLEGLRERYPGLRVFMAVRPEDAHLAPDHLVDTYFLDALAADRYGGTGTLTDWTRARVVVDEVQRPVVLAGGLTPQNVTDAIQTVRPYGVDVSTGVEGPDKKKDAAKIRAFVAAAHAAAPDRTRGEAPAR